ncbi:hypothetical protein [Streptomyces sp. CB01635]|uniref:hypothetical protein n=2 Tax=unclassified Streptomyces TaxID=2593676 RepID=UPI001F1AAB1C|nr:hypothetical protein [Streptomyces sp. CB01635]
MRERTGGRQRTYGKWHEATLTGAKLTGTDHVLVKAFAEPVFEAAAAKKEGNHGLAGYVGEWLWYLLTRDLPEDPARAVEILGPPKAAVNDGGGDGLIVYRESGTARGFSFRLWEMKKYTGKSNQPDGAIRKGWTQLSTKGATYLGMLSWGDKLLTDDTQEFVGSLAEQWVDEEESAGGGVSVALNTAAIPTKAFHLAHEHFTTHKHPGALQGLVVAIDNLQGGRSPARSTAVGALDHSERSIDFLIGRPHHPLLVVQLGIWIFAFEPVPACVRELVPRHGSNSQRQQAVETGPHCPGA